MRQLLSLSFNPLVLGGIVALFLTSSLSATDNFSLDDINASLQTEYQAQLSSRPKAKAPRAPVRRKAVTHPARSQPRVWQKPQVHQQKSAQWYQQRWRQQQQKTKRQSAQQQRTVPLYRAPAVRSIPPTPQKRTAVPSADKLFEAATYGNVGLIGRLLQEGVNVNATNGQRETALHMAAANGRYSALIYLITHGANIHARTVQNWLPIHHAARFRKANIANYLMQRGSSPHARTSDGKSAIDMARASHDQRLLSIFRAR